ncbi:hypothetical protein [Neomegalonema sp.]|uniref:hypothetical protein n=1 Tax=Neomegalonema sp. TaxID=2039713 RepID=UPI00262D1D05|nr:hypothetical protein [Neomegalonema sp.]MDD2868997.1 hypothetical protein [Neomegalonema sp.]
MNHLLWALLGLSLFSAPARAQEAAPEDFPSADAAYVGQVNALLDAARRRLEGAGFELQHRQVSAVEANTNWDSEAYLEEGERYAVVAVCDVDCNDVDLQIEDPSGGEAASDYGMSDTGFARFTALETGTFKAQVRMYGCQAPACYAAVGVFKQGLGPKTPPGDN